MDNIEVNKLINRVQKDLIDHGMDSEKIIPNLREIRSIFSAAKEPRLTRMVRMTIEHIEENDTFLIEMPKEEPEEGEEPEEVEEVEEEEDDRPAIEKEIESLDYMLQLMTKPTNKFNATELNAYFKMLVADSKK